MFENLVVEYQIENELDLLQVVIGKYKDIQITRHPVRHNTGGRNVQHHTHG